MPEFSEVFSNCILSDCACLQRDQFEVQIIINVVIIKILLCDVKKVVSNRRPIIDPMSNIGQKDCGYVLVSGVK